MLDMTRWLTLLVFLFWLLVYWQGGFKILSDICSAIKNNVSRLDAFLLAALAALGLGMTVTVIGAVIKPIEMLGWGDVPVVAGLGFLLTLAGVVGTFYCRAVLGKFWTAETAKQAGHVVIEHGPYRVVRHPIYSFAIMLYLGLGLAFPFWWSLLAAAGIALGYALKAWEEEKFLERTLAGYGEYKKRVRWRLLPGVW